MKLFSALVLGVFVFSSTLAQISIKEFKSQKVLYDFDENAVLKAKIKNQGKTGKDVIAEAFIKKGVDKVFKLPSKKVTIPAGGAKDVSFNWNVGKNEYGHAAFLTLKDEKGNVVAESKPEIFEVCHDWRKIMRCGGLPIYHGAFDPASPNSSEKYMDHIISFMRDWGYNRFHFFASWQPEIDNLSPSENEWHYWQHKEDGARKSWQTVKVNKAKIKKWIKKLHENGIKATMYMHTPTYKIYDESWAVYDRKNLKHVKYGGDSKIRHEWLVRNGIGGTNCMKFSEDFGKKLAKAIKEYDWDGCFLDDYGALATYTFKGVDRTGKPLTNMPYGEIHKKGLELLVENVKKAKDNFALMPNGLHGVMYGIEQFPARDMFGKDGEKFKYIKSAALPNIAFAGEWRSITGQANSPWQLGRSLRAVREATGVPLDIVWTLACPKPWVKNDAAFHGKDAGYTYSVETVLPFTAIIFSNGFGYSEYYTGLPRSFSKNDPVADGRKKYIKFAARYGQYMYDLNSHWTPKDDVKVEAPDHVYWKGNTFERKFKDRREVYLHLVNFDKMYLAAKLWDRTRTVPKEVDGIKAKIKLRSGEKVTGAYAATPDNGGEPVKLPFTVKNGVVEIQSPKLKYWNMLVVNIENKN